jgi:hypothetical protein
MLTYEGTFQPTAHDSLPCASQDQTYVSTQEKVDVPTPTRILCLACGLVLTKVNLVHYVPTSMRTMCTFQPSAHDSLLFLQVVSSTNEGQSSIGMSKNLLSSNQNQTNFNMRTS